MQNGTRQRLQAPPGAVVAAQTYHVVGTYDRTTSRLYLNGVQMAQMALTGAVGSTANGVSIGSWGTGAEFLKGTVDEAAVYPSALSAARVKSHYDAGVTTSAGGCRRRPT
jgi:concanavalin A-like lectin/glucanase superfamily protein